MVCPEMTGPHGARGGVDLGIIRLPVRNAYREPMRQLIAAARTELAASHLGTADAEGNIFQIEVTHRGKAAFCRADIGAVVLNLH